MDPTADNHQKEEKEISAKMPIDDIFLFIFYKYLMKSYVYI